MARFATNRSYLEAKFPTCSEDTGCTTGRKCEDEKLGRLPAFLFEDAQSLARYAEKNAYKTADPWLVMGDVEDSIDAAKYRKSFAHAFQYFQSRCQLHIHKLVNGKRIIPNACRSRHKPQECKHEAPWSNRVSPAWMKSPLLVCKGIAKKFKLRCSGFRNWLGQTLLMRNEAWVNGTMLGLCIALAGSNSDVRPNDRLPILDCTHEAECGKKRCLGSKGHLKKSTRVTQRTQSVINGYFGGYVGKRQPAGALETRKCVDKLFTLRARYHSKGKAAQLRAASGRLITDLEMNSTYRGSVEIFNSLCGVYTGILGAHPRRPILDVSTRNFPGANKLERRILANIYSAELEAKCAYGSFASQ